MTSPPSTGSDSLTCPQCHKHVDQAAWVMHPRYCTAADPAGAPAPTATIGVAGSGGAASARPVAQKGSGEISMYLIVGVLLQFVGGVLLGGGFANMTSTDLLRGTQEPAGAP